jgi:SAM-dependent methyltransferase
MHCRICDSTNLVSAIDLGNQPWCNHFLTKDEIGNEPYYPLRVVYCQDCHTAQLNFTVKKEVMFGNHTYLSGITKSLSAHFADIALEVDRRFLAGRNLKSVLDIGSNDGTQLKHYQNLGYDVLGVESSVTTAQIANEAGIPTLNEFFNDDTAMRLNRTFDVINASGVFFHLEELHSVCEGIKRALKDDGVFVAQFLYMKSIMENNAFDQIYHEHLLYYTLETIETLLRRHGLSMHDAYLDSIHGGSIIGFISHVERLLPPSSKLTAMRWKEEQSGCNTFEAYEEFSVRIEEMRHKNVAFLENAKAAGKRVFGFGAPVKGNTMLNYFQVGPELIECLVEKNPLRRGLYSPGMHIPVLIEDELRAVPDCYFVLAWNFKKEILSNNRKLIESGVEFYFPVDPGVNA